MLSIYVILFLLLMIFIWGHYGLFSALLHLIVTIVAAVLAVALWEPVAYFLLPRKLALLGVPAGEYAWGLGLLGPFVVLLVVLRVALDKLVKGNVDLSQLANTIGGGVCGLLAGILTAGLTVIGMGFLPLDASLGHYRPLVIDVDGKVVANEGSVLWPPVDRYAAGFLQRLSDGSFYSGAPLGRLMPKLHRQHALYRLRNDENASVSAPPDAVELGQYFAHRFKDLPPEKSVLLSGEKVDVDDELVLIETLLTFHVPPYDADSMLRLPPTNVRLLTRPSDDRPPSKTQMHAPVALVFVHPKGQRQFVHIDRPEVSADTSAHTQTIGWVFLLPERQEPQYLLFRHLRLRLPKSAHAERDTRKVALSLGEPETEEEAEPEGGEQGEQATEESAEFGERRGVKTGTRPTDPQINDELPRLIHRRKTSLTIQDKKVLSGHDDVKPPQLLVQPQDRVDRIHVSAKQRSLRIRLGPDTVRSLLGRTRAMAANLSPILLRDSTGQHYLATGYVRVQPNGTQTIHFDPMRPIRAASELPRLGSNDEIYLYFIVPADIRVVSYQVGSNTKWSLDPPLEVR